MTPHDRKTIVAKRSVKPKLLAGGNPQIQKADVKVTFFQGASLRPLPPGESKQQDVRYLDIREDDRLDEAQLTAWMRRASQLPGWGKV